MLTFPIQGQKVIVIMQISIKITNFLINYILKIWYKGKNQHTDNNLKWVIVPTEKSCCEVVVSYLLVDDQAILHTIAVGVSLSAVCWVLQTGQMLIGIQVVPWGATSTVRDLFTTYHDTHRKEVGRILIKCMVQGIPGFSTTESFETSLWDTCVVVNKKKKITSLHTICHRVELFNNIPYHPLFASSTQIQWHVQHDKGTGELY